MRIGVVYPQTEYPQDPITIRDYAQAVEALGYTHILAYSHVLGANPSRPGGWQGPYTYKDPFMEPLILFSYMAAVTDKIEFTTGIIILPQRQTALFAKQAAVLDVLSGGRLRVGIGLGWNKVEFEALNQNYHNRGKRVEEQVEVLRLLWTKPLVNFHGRWHQIPDAGINPLPVQRPIPVWFGGHHENVLRRIARMGDGWMPNYGLPTDAAPALEKLNRYLVKFNRNRDEIGLEPRMKYGDGDPKIWHQLLSDWEGLGATHLSINTMGHGFKHPDNHIRALEIFARSVGVKRSTGEKT